MFILSIHSCHLKETFGCPKTWQSEKQGQRNRGDADITISKWCQELQQPYQVICYHDENKHLCIKVLCNGYTPQLVISENLCDKVCSDLLLTSSSLDKTLKKKMSASKDNCMNMAHLLFSDDNAKTTGALVIHD